MSDFCYSRPMLERVLRQAELMDRMTERLGMDRAALARIDQGMAWYEARSRCIACCRETVCRQWLETARAPAAPPDFCANAGFFRATLDHDPESAAPPVLQAPSPVPEKLTA
jgi:hypothetical protein